MRDKYTKTYYRLLHILKPIFIFLYHPKLVNKEVIPKDGPIILAGNHVHIFDPGCVAISTDRQMHFLAKEFLFEYPIVGPLFEKVGCIKVLKEKKNGTALYDAIEVLKRGDAIGIFPEGKVKTEDVMLNPFKYGAVKMAQETGSRIIPFAISGRYIPFFGNVKITYGEPLDVSKMELKEANEYLHEKVEELIKKEDC
ncbi:MAG: lysophospholipid acyltransferase family protein [Erysipelotrichaceae bacterium]|nr:lysophospholipid acyltransferase family protein [Erysipelotrichaceae bacterium]